MRILVRYVSHKSKLNATLQEVPLQGARLKIGRGTDQDIHLANLRVALAHAELVEGRNGQIRLQSHLAAGFHYNGAVVQAAMLAPDDRIELGGFIIRVGSAPGSDLVLDIAEDPAARGNETEIALRKRARMDLAAAGLRKRPLALGLALAVVVLMLLIPLVAATVPAAGKWLRFLPLMPSDHAWSSGMVSAAHAHIGTNCTTCHTVPFLPTRNSACLSCHQNTVHHVESDRLKTGLFEGARCGSCHQEHLGRSSLVRHDERLCVKCHGDLKRVAPDTQVADVRNFAVDHPEFRPPIVHDEGTRAIVQRVVLSDTKALHESPGIEFSHQQHLAAAGIASPQRGAVKLACADCHQVEPGGGRMRPVSFEKNCHECHQLGIPGDSVREAPHGDVAAMIATVADYYQAWALRGGYPNVLAPRVVQTRRLPGQGLAPAVQQDALSWAQHSSELATAEMLAYTACGTCHTVRPTGIGEGATAWRLSPVRIPHEWLPQSHFSHARHDTQACADCHAGASKSDTSADVLLPGIATCRTCHGSGDADEGKLASTCVNCHQFHRAKTAHLTD